MVKVPYDYDKRNDMCDMTYRNNDTLYVFQFDNFAKISKCLFFEILLFVIAHKVLIWVGSCDGVELVEVFSLISSPITTLLLYEKTY